MEEDLPGNFGNWLRAEVREMSPYGKLFYGKATPLLDNAAMVSEPDLVNDTQAI